MEKNNREKTKISLNIIDYSIFLLTLALIVGISLRTGNFVFLENSPELSTYSMNFSVSDIADTSVDYFNVSDEVTIADSGVFLGKLERLISVTPAKKYIKDSSGRILLVEYPDETRVDVKGTLEVKGSVNNKCFLLGGSTRITPGDSFSVKTEQVDFVLTVTDIVKK